MSSTSGSAAAGFASGDGAEPDAASAGKGMAREPATTVAKPVTTAIRGGAISGAQARLNNQCKGVTP
ncbi:hypothetical protein GCM10009525_66940 [Streptosporangium amethystogenes subsp. fukuiense]